MLTEVNLVMNKMAKTVKIVPLLFCLYRKNDPRWPRFLCWKGNSEKTLPWKNIKKDFYHLACLFGWSKSCCGIFCFIRQKMSIKVTSRVPTQSVKSRGGTESRIRLNIGLFDEVLVSNLRIVFLGNRTLRLHSAHYADRRSDSAVDYGKVFM